MSNIKSIISGTGSFLPEKIITNHDLAKFVDTDDEWITQRSGIKQRHYIDDNMLTSDMAASASLKAINNASIVPNDIDMIICATITPDVVFPSVASIVQRKLNITNNCPAFDVSAACSGFIYALSTADAFIKSGQAKHILIIGADAMSRIVDFKDRSTCVLFGDGAGAFIISASNSDKDGILSTVLHTDGQLTDILQCHGGAGAKTDKFGFLTMKGQEVFKVAVKCLTDVMQKTLDKAKISSDQVDWVVPHQANQRIMDMTAQKLNIDTQKVISYIADHGNTSAASVPLAFDCAIQDVHIKKGDIILLEAIGGGMAWGGAVLKY